MSKKTSSSLTKLPAASLKPLHDAILQFTGEPAEWAKETERHREKAFNARSSSKLFKYWYLRSEVLKRYQGPGVPAKTRVKAAIGTFVELEASARLINDRLSDGWGKPWPDAIRKRLMKARRVIGETLGTAFPWEQFPLACDFSSGASTELPRLEAARQKKWLKSTDVTEKALPYALAFRRWANLDQVVPTDGPFTDDMISYVRGPTTTLKVVEANKVFTVPKRFDKDRTCAKEPSWNMFFQKGVGTLIRSRLNQVGLLHPDAQEHHARLAQQASRDGIAATLDLKGASDLVTVGLVALLLPEAWVRVLLDLRSPKGLVDGLEGSITYEKISSMGNGYTFELETLIFWALAVACCSDGEEVSVYGDDVICPANRARLIQRVFSFVGFELNQEKSFSSGPFRESCGGHFWRGVNVKPFYIEQLPTTRYQIINLHNDIVEWMSTGPILDRLVAIARLCRRLIPRKYWGPRFTAGVLWSEWDEARPTFQKPPSRRNQPYYGHWRVRSIRREVIVQTHDYYLGSLLDEYWQKRHQSRQSLLRPHGRSSFALRQAALARRSEELRTASTSDFTFALTREVEGWVAVGVGLEWPRLPVRLA